MRPLWPASRMNCCNYHRSLIECNSHGQRGNRERSFPLPQFFRTGRDNVFWHANFRRANQTMACTATTINTVYLCFGQMKMEREKPNTLKMQRTRKSSRAALEAILIDLIAAKIIVIQRVLSSGHCHRGGWNWSFIKIDTVDVVAFQIHLVEEESARTAKLIAFIALNLPCHSLCGPKEISLDLIDSFVTTAHRFGWLACGREDEQRKAPTATMVLSTLDEDATILVPIFNSNNV